MELVNLDVGGTVFRFRRDTLTQYPNTFLGAMFANDNPGDNTYEENGKTYYFFDRNPEIFGIVADFYRSGRYNIVKKPARGTYKSVAEELDFWCIPEEACSSPEIYKIAGSLSKVLSEFEVFQSPVIITNRWVHTSYWKDNIVPDSICTTVCGVEMDKNKMFAGLDQIINALLPSDLMINALRRKGIDTEIKFHKFTCGYRHPTLVLLSEPEIAIRHISTCCDGDCVYISRENWIKLQESTDNCLKETDHYLTIRRI